LKKGGQRIALELINNTQRLIPLIANGGQKDGDAATEGMCGVFVYDNRALSVLHGVSIAIL
jgi:hypothetical protein